MTTPDDVLTFWFDPALDPQARQRRWFMGGPALDDEIRARFADDVRRARAGDHDAWAATPRGRLALIVLLDQFSRNAFRGTPEAFAADPRALALARQAVRADDVPALDALLRLFLVLPFEHAEDLDAQREGVALAERIYLEAAADERKDAAMTLDWAKRHLAVIARFGRFPTRNAALGRADAPGEAAYLAYLRASGDFM